MGRKINFEIRVKNLIEKYNTSNPYQLCRKLKIELKYHDLGNIKGYFKKVLRRKYIVLNDNLDEIEEKMILCHELCHAIYHSSKKHILMKSHFLGYPLKLEKQANDFMFELLKYNNDISYEVLRKCENGIELFEKLKRQRY